MYTIKRTEPDFLTDDERREIWVLDQTGPLPTNFVYQTWYQKITPTSLPNLIAVAQLGRVDWWPKVGIAYEVKDDMAVIEAWTKTNWPTAANDWIDLTTACLCLKSAPTDAFSDLLSVFFKSHSVACSLLLVHQIAPAFLQYRINRAQNPNSIDVYVDQDINEELCSLGFESPQIWLDHVEAWLTSGLHAHYWDARRSLNPPTPPKPPPSKPGGDQGGADSALMP
jgi:hypothetical protein